MIEAFRLFQRTFSLFLGMIIPQVLDSLGGSHGKVSPSSIDVGVLAEVQVQGDLPHPVRRFSCTHMQLGPTVDAWETTRGSISPTRVEKYSTTTPRLLIPLQCGDTSRPASTVMPTATIGLILRPGTPWTIRGISEFLLRSIRIPLHAILGDGVMH